MVHLMNDWLTAYSTVADVAATLTGLLFVSVSVKLATVSDETRRWMLFIAKRSFLDFLTVLAIALMFLVPGASSLAMGWVILGLGAIRSAWHVRHWYKRSKLTSPDTNSRSYVVSMAATGMLIIAGAATLLAWDHTGKLTYAAAILLLFDACQNAWRLLTR
jgi:hypothetical protein